MRIALSSLNTSQLSALAGLFTLTVGDNTNTAFTLTSGANDTLTFTIDNEVDFVQNDEQVISIAYNAGGTADDLSDATLTDQKTPDFTQAVTNAFIPPIPSTTASETYVKSASEIELKLSEAAESNAIALSSLNTSQLSALAGLFTLTVGDNTNTSFTLTSGANDTLTFTIDSEADLFKTTSSSFRLRITQREQLSMI